MASSFNRRVFGGFLNAGSNPLLRLSYSRSMVIEAMVSLGNTKRVIQLPPDSKLEHLKETFTKEFIDVIPKETMATAYDFYVFDPRFDEYVEMDGQRKLFDGIKVVAKMSKEVTQYDQVIDHPLIDKRKYYIWSLVSRKNSSFIKRNGLQMMCNGNRDDVIIAKYVKDPTKNLFRLEMNNPDKPSTSYVITGGEEKEPVFVQEVPYGKPPPKDEESKFEPSYFFAYTQFRCNNVNGRIDLYLSSDVNGKMTLVQGGTRGYPDPSTLFICNETL